MTLQQPHLIVREHEGRVLARFAFQADESLVAGLQIVAQPYTYAGGRNLQPGQAQLIGHPLGAVGRTGEAIIQDLGLDLRGDTVGMRIACAAPAFDQPGHAAGLEGPADLVERVPVVAHDLAGAGHVARFIGQLQQGELEKIGSGPLFNCPKYLAIPPIASLVCTAAHIAPLHFYASHGPMRATWAVCEAGP